MCPAVLQGISNLMNGGKTDPNPEATKGKAKKLQGEIETLQVLAVSGYACWRARYTG